MLEHVNLKQEKGIDGDFQIAGFEERIALNSQTQVFSHLEISSITIFCQISPVSSSAEASTASTFTSSTFDLSSFSTQSPAAAVLVPRSKRKTVVSNAPALSTSADDALPKVVTDSDAKRPKTEEGESEKQQ